MLVTAGCGSRERRAEVARWLERLHVSATGPSQSVAGLSGGNQQKVALARLLHQQADVLLLDEPTRGIDVGSKAEIYRVIGELAAQGKAILVVSSYLPELFGICDRIAVMSRGALCEARATSQWTEHEVMEVATRTESLARARPDNRCRQSIDPPTVLVRANRETARGRQARAETVRSSRFRAARHARLGVDGLRTVSGTGVDHGALRGARPANRADSSRSTTGRRSRCSR